MSRRRVTAAALALVTTGAAALFVTLAPAQAADGGVAPCTGPPTHVSSAVSEFSVPAQTAMYIPYLSLSAKPSPLTSISAPVTGSPEVGFTVRVAT